MQSTPEEPPCPQCGNHYTVRIFTAMYAAKFDTSPLSGAFNPFSLFTTHRARGSHRGRYALLELIGGLLTAVVLIVTSPWQERRKLQREQKQGQQRDASQERYEAILQQCSPLYTCLSDRLVFAQGEQKTIPIAQILRMLNDGADAAALMHLLRA